MPQIPDLSKLSSAEKDALIYALCERIAELERRLGLSSTTSSKPPSSDGLKKARRVQSLREPSGKESGGQAGHEGSTLHQVESPDEVIDHYAVTCPDCGAGLAREEASPYQKRQVFDLPTPRPLHVTEHRAHRSCCAQCGRATQAAFPDEVTAAAQYGAGLRALVVYLQGWHLLPEDRLAELLREVFQVDLATATVAAMSHKKAEELTELAAHIEAEVKHAPVKHLDETGYRIAGRLHWLHVASTGLLTAYRTSRQRGAMLTGVLGIIVHDFWRSYLTMPTVLHALCNAHHLRELKALMTIDHETWARGMFRFLRQACHASHLARQRAHGLSPDFVWWLYARYDRILAHGFAFHDSQPPLPVPLRADGRPRRGRPRRRTGHNLLIRLRDHKEEVLRFLTNPTVPFTNNQAEQDLRMMKVKQKISGSFRTEAGAHTFTILRTVMSTARKQGWNILHTLSQKPALLIQQLRTS